LATIVQEIIATRFAFRAKVLEKAILRMLEDGKSLEGKKAIPLLTYSDRILGVLHLFGLVNLLKGKKIAPWFYAHPLIKYLAEDNYYSKPAYLDAKNFSKVIIDLLKGFNKPESETVQSIHNSITAGVINKLPINLSISADKQNPAVAVLRSQNPCDPDPVALAAETVPINTNTALFIRSLWSESGADVNLFRLKLEQWFDDTMERTTGWYKRYTRMILFGVGLVLAVIFNVDTIAVHRILSKDKSAREQLVAMAVRDHVKYADEVERIRRGDHAASDSVLKETYRMVKSDADAASGILGLGRPWADTIKRWKDSAETWKKNIKMLQPRYENVSMLLASKADYERQKLIADTSKPPNAAASNAAAQNLKKLDEALKAADAGNTITEYARLNILLTRGEAISKKRGGHWYNFRWLAYSPYQEGGAETIFGWIITALAIMLGAPFWFDLLARLVKIRGTGTKIGSSLTETSTPTPSSSAATAPGSPLAINVNSNTGEEAVG
jgi:hypothetical protein